jgi:type VI secretion system protein ImpG
MNDALLRCYEHELQFVRQLAQEFAKQYPRVANRLRLEQGHSIDPHVERLIEGFAFLTARIQNKIDDEFPELTDALLGVLYPHYLAPIPSMTVVQFEVDAGRAQLPNGFPIPRHSALCSPPVRDLPCKFRTGYPVTLWPIELTGARFQLPPFPAGLKPPPKAAAALRLQLECRGEMNFADLALDKLRFFLNGDNQLVPYLYDFLFNQTLQVVFRPLERDAKQAPITLDPQECLTQVGFERDEGLLPYPNQSFLGYRLLTEFFTFPYKFLFLDLGGWRRVCQARFSNRVEVVFFLKKTLPNLEQGVEAQTFRLNCVPIVNLFEQTAEPIPLTHSRYEYPIVPDVAHQDGMEVYSVEGVSSTNPTMSTTTEYRPFYSCRHSDSRESEQAFWYTSRRPSPWGDRGTDVYLSLADLNLNPRLPAEAVLNVRTLCTNGNLPTRLQHSGEDLDFELMAAAPLNRVRCLRSPTPPLRPPLRRGAQWRLVSHLCLNYLSLTDAGEAREALQELLRLYDFSDPEAGHQQAAVTQQLVEGILSVSSQRVVGRTGSPTSSGFARGIQVTIEFDEQKFVGTGAFLFASVLERFLALYASINSFTQLVGKTKQAEEYFKWPPRSGEQPLL